MRNKRQKILNIKHKKREHWIRFTHNNHQTFLLFLVQKEIIFYWLLHTPFFFFTNTILYGNYDNAINNTTKFIETIYFFLEFISLQMTQRIRIRCFSCYFNEMKSTFHPSTIITLKLSNVCTRATQWFSVNPTPAKNTAANFFSFFHLLHIYIRDTYRRILVLHFCCHSLFGLAAYSIL